MADENQNGNGGAEPIADSPDERLEEFEQLLGVPSSRYGDAVERALEHFRSAPVDALQHGWVALGPRNVGGAIRCLAQHPARQDVFFAGSSQGGLWKSEDNGYSWRPIGAATLIVPVGAIAIAASRPNVMYVGTGEPAHGPGGTGLYKSEDGGNSFSRVVGNASSGDDGAADHYRRLVVDPMEPERLWAATERGLWRRDPSGLLGFGGGFTAEVPGNVTDVALARDPGNADKYVLLAGVAGAVGVPGGGIFRAEFSRSSGRTGPWSAAASVAATTLVATGATALPATGFGRIRIAFSGIRTRGATPITTPIAYAIMEDLGVMGYHPVAPHPSAGNNRLKYPTFVYRSQDFGRTWFADAGSIAIQAPPPPPSTFDKDGQAGYSLVIAVDPHEPEHVLAGYINLHSSIDRGKTFTTILDWEQYDTGDRAQHGDQHAIVFDRRDSRQVWVCNDGGISFTENYMPPVKPPIPGATNAPVLWRKRSYGVGAAQFTAISTHPRFPFICGGGMQDNGTFVSYGGPTWYRLDGGDGGQMAFHPVDPRQFFTTSQDGIDPVQILDHSSALRLYRSTLPDVDPPGNVMVPGHAARLVFPSPANDPVFVGIVEADPTTPGRLLIGRKGAGFYTLNGNATPPTLTPFTPALPAIPPAPSSTVPPPPPTPDEVSAMAFAPGGNDVWVGTLGGLVFRFTAPPGTALPVSSPPPPIGSLPGRAAAILQGVGAARVNAIVVHPQNANVVAVGVNWGVVFLSHDGGQNWANINGSGRSLPSSRITSLAFDPGNTQVIFAGTMAGVWVARNLPPLPTGAAVLGATFDAEWKTYSAGLPPVQVNDLEVTPIRNTLRCATFGRGAFEAELPPATPVIFRIPEVRLMIRSNPIDDSYVRDRPGGNHVYPNLFFDDPRLPAPPAPAPDFDYTHALDIRVDAPGFIRSEAFKFGEAIDGVEFDETLVSDKPLAGDINHVYVQVHNRGFGAAANVKVSLYFAEAKHVPAPAGPLTPPNIDNRINYPGDPPADSPWQLAASQTLGALAPGEPTVARFEWLAPLELTDGVALMAVCSNDKDQLAAIPPGDPIAFIKAERRAALRITAVNRDTVYIRDGVDDDARPGGVAWGGRSPDLIVVQAAVANPDDPAGPFKDLDDQRTSDVVKAGANFIYVRIFNRTRVAANAKVQIYIYPLPIFDLALTTGGTQLPKVAPLEVAVNAIAPRGWKFATFNWNGVTDPDPANASTYKGFVLLAMASVVGAAGAELDPYPNLQDVTDLESFWRFFKSGPLANNAAVRALRFQP